MTRNAKNTEVPRQAWPTDRATHFDSSPQASPSDSRKPLKKQGVQNFPFLENNAAHGDSPETSGSIRNPSFSIPARANSAPDGSAAAQPTDSLGAVRKDEVKRPQELAFTKGFGTFELDLRFSAKREANSAMAASVSEIIPLGDGRDEGDSDGTLGVRLRLREMSSGFENNGMGGFAPSVFAAIGAMVLHDKV